MLGGATTFLLNFRRALAPEGGRLSIVTFGENTELAADLAAAGAEVRTGDLGRLIFEDRLAWGYRELANLQPHAVLACLGSESFEMLRLAPPGVARIGVIQSDDPGPYGMARRYHAVLDAMVGVSPAICEKLRAIPEFARTRVVEIPYGIHFAEAPARPPAASGEPLRILYLGRVIEVQKRIGRLVALIKQLEKTPGDFRVTIAGSGPQEAEVRAQLAGSPIVTMLGAVPNAAVPELLRAHDVYLLLSDFEGLPLSLLEAMGEGLVPVVSDLPSGIREVVPDSIGVRVPIGDLDAAEGALRALHLDRARLARLSAGARTRARGDYSARLMVERYLDLVRTIVPAGTAPSWPAQVRIPAPHGVPGWLYSGLPRLVRRRLKALAVSSSATK